MLGFKSTPQDASSETLKDADEGSPLDPIAKTEIETGIVQLESLLNSTVDRNFDKLEIYTLRNLLTVSNVKEDEGLESWVMLDHYKVPYHSLLLAMACHGLIAREPRKGPPRIPDPTLTAHQQDLNHPSTVPATNPDTLHALRRKLQETEKLHHALRAEQARNDALLTQLRALVPTTDSHVPTQQTFKSESTPAPDAHPSLSFLTSTPPALGANASASLAQNTQFTLSQVPALQALLARLRPRLASLPRSELRGVKSEAGDARERYLTAQSARAMERRGVGGGDAGAGAVAGAEGLGRRVGGEEVRALEGVVGALGGRVGGGDEMEE